MDNFIAPKLLFKKILILNGFSMSALLCVFLTLTPISAANANCQDDYDRKR